MKKGQRLVPWRANDFRLERELLSLRQENVPPPLMASIISDRAGFDVSEQAVRHKLRLLGAVKRRPKPQVTWQRDDCRLGRELERLRATGLPYCRIASHLSELAGADVSAQACRSRMREIRDRARGDEELRLRRMADTIERLRTRVEELEVILDEHGIDPRTALRHSVQPLRAA